MTSKVFIDTNILIYTEDTFNKAKQTKARECIREIVDHGRGVISTQVLQEYYVAAIRKLNITPLHAKKQIIAWKNLEVVTITADFIEKAIDISILDQISFWDALIVVAALEARCPILWTEDLNPGQIIHGLKIQNPLLG